MGGVRLLVCGGRTYANPTEMDRILTKVATLLVVEVIIEGEARGADEMAREWARSNGVPYEAFPADWRNYGKAAGPIRNQVMLDRGKPKLVVAFPSLGSKGTWDMVNRSRAAGLTVWVMPADEHILDELLAVVFT